jgi:hypothetical protein
VKKKIVLQTQYDGSQPDLTGICPGGCVVYAATSEKSQVGDTCNYFGVIDAETANFL